MKYKVTMKHYTRSVGRRLVDYAIEETITAEGFESRQDAEDYAASCREVHFENVNVKVVEEE